MTMTNKGQAVQTEKPRRNDQDQHSKEQQQQQQQQQDVSPNVNNGLPSALNTLHQSTVDLSLAAAQLALECQKTQPEEETKYSSEADADDKQQHRQHDVETDEDNEIIPFVVDQSSSEYYERKDDDDIDEISGDDNDDDDDDDEKVEDTLMIKKSNRQNALGLSRKPSHPQKLNSSSSNTIMSSSFNSNNTNTQPVVVISLQKLCGYIPSTSDEYEQIKQTLVASLLGKQQQPHEEGSTTTTTTMAQQQLLGDGVSMDFTLRSTELFDIGAAVHGFVSTASSKTATNIWVPRCSSCGGSSVPNGDNDKPFETCFMMSKPLPSQITTSNQHSMVIVPYPDYLIMSSTSSEATSSNLVSTQQIWSILDEQQTKKVNGSSNDVVQWVYYFLSICNRSLLWKYQMIQSIEVLVEEETEYFLSKQYQKWQCQDRTAKLEKLYEIRDLLEQQLEELSNKSQQLKQDRYLKVQQLMEQQNHLSSTTQQLGGEDGSGGGSNNKDNLNTTTMTTTRMDLSKETFDFLLSDDDDDDSCASTSVDDHDGNRNYKKEHEDAFDDSPTYNGTTTASDYDNKDTGSDSDNDDGDGDDDDDVDEILSDDDCNTDDDGDSLDVNNTSHQQRMPNTTTRNSKRRHLRRRDILKSRQDKLKQEESQKQELKDARNQRRLLKKQLLKQHLTKEEITTKALEQQLRTKFLQTDELLENLQDEQWEYEEQQQQQDNENDDGGDDDDNEARDNDDNPNNENGNSLLDSILAMILGSLTSPIHLKHLNLMLDEQQTTSSSSDEDIQKEFYQQLKQLHDTILQKWKNQFGRLPPPLVVSSPPSSRSTKQESSPISTPHLNKNDDADDTDKHRVVVVNVGGKHSSTSMQHQHQHQHQQQHTIRDTWEDFDLDDDDDDDDDDNDDNNNGLVMDDAKDVVADTISASTLGNKIITTSTPAETATTANTNSVTKKGLRPGGKVVRRG